MNITLVVKLNPSPEQRSALLETMERFNAACDIIAETAFKLKSANKVDLQKVVYHDIRKQFCLSSQMTIRAIAKVCEVYKRDKKIKPAFKPYGAIVYDQRIHSWKGLDRVSLLTLGGREIIPVIMGQYQEARFLRKKLQTKGTNSAKRLLKKRRHKEQRFARDVNHCISKRIVQKAYDTCRGIAVEDLTGIRDRVTVRKAQRRTHHSWAFYQLRQFITYKAAMLGVPVVAVDPRYTSQQCPECGVIDRKNRPTRDSFHCVSCGHAAPADTTAGRNIAARANVMLPYAVAA